MGFRPEYVPPARNMCGSPSPKPSSFGGAQLNQLSELEIALRATHVWLPKPVSRDVESTLAPKLPNSFVSNQGPRLVLLVLSGPPVFSSRLFSSLFVGLFFFNKHDHPSCSTFKLRINRPTFNAPPLPPCDTDTWSRSTPPTHTPTGSHQHSSSHLRRHLSFPGP